MKASVCVGLVILAVLAGSVGAKAEGRMAKSDLPAKKMSAGRLSADKHGHQEMTWSSRRFAKVEIVLSEEVRLADIEGLPRAPGSNLEVAEKSGRVVAELAAGAVKSFIAKGAEITVLDNFVLVEGSAGPINSEDGDMGITGACSGANEYGLNNANVRIPDDDFTPEWVYSDISISAAPAAAMVTCIDVHYEILHPWVGDLIVDLTNQTVSIEYNLWDSPYADWSDLYETETGITEFNGEQVNQIWLLWAIDVYPSYDNAWIDSWWIKVYYDDSGLPGYCSAGGAECEEYIAGVEVGEISNMTDCNNYADYTSMSTTMEIGTGYPITVTNGKPYSSDECGIWVDWNGDEDFEDANETISVSGNPGGGPYTGTISPPADANLGDTRMRIRILDSDYDTMTPCWTTSYGEVEDYTITVTGEPQTLKVSGHAALSNGVPVEGILVTVETDGSSEIITDTTDANGYYEIQVQSPWSGSVSWSKDKYYFNWPTHYSDITEDLVANISAFYQYSGGLGTHNFPYEIATPEDMNAIGAHPEDWDKYFRLIADIDLSDYTGTEFNIIGTSSEPFLGVFDGNGHVISDFNYVSALKNNIGVFGYVDSPNAEIKNTALIDLYVDVDRGSAIGSVVGFLKSGAVNNCSVKNGYVRGEDNTGGLIGRSSGTISNCHFNGDVTVVWISITYSTGGLVGLNEGLINSCYTQGTVKGDNSGGGLVGKNLGGNISNCYSKSNVSGVWSYAVPLGGLVGKNVGIVVAVKPAIISNCYSTGHAPNGLVGHNATGYMAHVYNSFWDVESSQCSSSSAGMGLTTAGMQMKSTFTDVGWDFNDVWKICDGTNYPKLQWEFLLGDFVCPDGVDLLDFAVLGEQWGLEKLSWDVGPDGGDGIVNFLDWAVFANGWQSGGDMSELGVFVSQWLGLSAWCADIAPAPDGDGVVNWADVAAFGNNWLKGVGAK